MNDVLPLTLALAVPLWIDQLSSLTDAERLAMAQECSQVIAEHGDIILYRGGKKGETAAAFNMLAKGIAIGAYQPGGITAFGQHYCTDHAECLDAEKKARIFKPESSAVVLKEGKAV
jgi:hypothetical protein